MQNFDLSLRFLLKLRGGITFFWISVHVHLIDTALKVAILNTRWGANIYGIAW